MESEMTSVESDYRKVFEPYTLEYHYELNYKQKELRVFQEVHYAVKHICNSYSDNNLRLMPSLDVFFSPIFRLAYFYRFFVSHAYILKMFFLKSYLHCRTFQDIMNSLIDSRHIRMCAIGGGPGTDIAGLFLFIHAQRLIFPTTAILSTRLSWQYRIRNNANSAYHWRDSGPWNILQMPSPWSFNFNFGRPIPQNYVFGSVSSMSLHPLQRSFSPSGQTTRRKPVLIQPCVMDICADWKHMADMIFHTIKKRTGNDVCELDDILYNSVDLADKTSLDNACLNCPGIAIADIVTMVKVVSAMAGDDQRRKKTMISLETIFHTMKTGAIVFYMDNAGGGVTKLITIAACNSGLVELYRAEHVVCRIPSNEKLEFLEPFRQYFNIGPQCRSTVSVVMWMKPNYNQYNVY